MIGIITKDRYHGLEVLLNSLNPINESIVIMDASIHPRISNIEYTRFFNIHPSNTTQVVFNKNALIRIFLRSTEEHLFLIEDDIKILDNDVFEEYILKGKQYNLCHMNFNKPRTNELIYSMNSDITVYEHCEGGFQYFNRKCLEITGLMDESFCNNMWEHVEHTIRIHRDNGYIPWVWHFPDLSYSSEMIRYQNIESSIKKDSVLVDKEMNRMWNKFGGFQPIDIQRLKIINK